MRDEKIIRKLLKALENIEIAHCPADPYYSACNLDTAVDLLSWVLGESDDIDIVTWEIDVEVRGGKINLRK